MDDTVVQLLIRDCAADDVRILEACMPTGGTEAHATHFREQESGGCTYLTGWLNDVPVASCVVRWNGCHAPQVRLAFPDCVEITNLGVRPDARDRGIGTQMVAAAEERIRSQRGSTVGVGVADDNLRAAALYARLGYSDTGARYETTYSYRDEGGEIQPVTEHNVFLIKHLQ
jgi:ribosomal protein S18 acetylase RimI-like enzyme